MDIWEKLTYINCVIKRKLTNLQVNTKGTPK